jgi:excisionase family DNA binding protein
LITHLDNTLPALLTRQEVSQLLRCSERKVDELARTGELQSFKIGSNRRFHRADVLGLIPQRRA